MPEEWRVPPSWRGETVVCIGGGPSLTQAQVDHCRGRARVIAINDAYRLAPWADALYFCDHRWWGWHRKAPAYKAFAGLRVTLDARAAAADQTLKWLRNTGCDGLESDPTGLRTGRNSGYQAINLAVHLGAHRIVLLGYDMRIVDGRDHWFGQHPGYPLKESHFANAMLPNFATLVAPLAERGIEVINATPDSALTVFPHAELGTVLPTRPFRPLCSDGNGNWRGESGLSSLETVCAAEN